MIQRLASRLRNLYYWLPVIWKDQNWDYQYLRIIMRHKLIAMRDHFESTNSVAADSRELAAEIQSCITDLDALIADDFCGREWKEHWVRFPDTIDGEATQEAAHNIRLLCMLEDKRQKDCEERLFATLRDKYTRWWD